MIIRATKKVLNISGLEPEKRDTELEDSFPGEWYVDLISLGRSGKLGLQFLHHPTKIIIIVAGKSLNKAIDVFRIRLREFLTRNGFLDLYERFNIENIPEILPTNDRGMLAHMNQIKRNSEYYCAKSLDLEKINYNWIEDIYLKYPFRSKKTGRTYLMSKNILKDFQEGS